MCGTAALRAGAGLVTVACPEAALSSIAAYSPELMTEPLQAGHALKRIQELAGKLTLTAIGPGIGTDDETREVVRTLFATLDKPMVVDADALNCIAGTDWKSPGAPRILTPHPGEMSRLTGRTIPEVQADRIGIARALATERGVILVLKGEGTVIAFPDGRVWINTTGSPAMATGGTGDILTGMTAGLAGQFSKDLDRAVAAAVYVHGLSGELAARHLCEQPSSQPICFATCPREFVPSRTFYTNSAEQTIALARIVAATEGRSVAHRRSRSGEDDPDERNRGSSRSRNSRRGLQPDLHPRSPVW